MIFSPPALKNAGMSAGIAPTAVLLTSLCPSSPQPKTMTAETKTNNIPEKIRVKSFSLIREYPRKSAANLFLPFYCRERLVQYPHRFIHVRFPDVQRRRSPEDVPIQAAL